jgi:hypothetical protein
MKNWRDQNGSGCDLTDRHMPGEPEGNHEISQDNLRSGQDENREPPEYQSRMSSLCHSARVKVRIVDLETLKETKKYNYFLINRQFIA